jgi:hypothetical protein
MKAIYLVSGGIAFVAAFLLTMVIAKLPPSPPPVPSSKADVVSLETRRRICAAESLAAFPEFHRPPDLDVSRSHADHYDPRLGRCLVLLDTSALRLAHDGEMVTHEELREIDGARYGAITISRDLYRQTVQVESCALTPPGGPASVCHAPEAWDGFVALYMGADGPQ